MTPPLKTTLLLIRHGESTANVERKLTGRAPGVPLTARGRQQAAEVAAALAKSKITQIYSSPVERARETAAFLEHLLHIPVQTAEGINETDCGDWTGWSAEECTKMPEWKILRDQPENFCFPGGESFDVITELPIPSGWRRRHFWMFPWPVL